MRTIISTLLALTAWGPWAMAEAGEAGAYLSMGYSHQIYDEQRINQAFNFDMLMGRVGYRLHRYGAVEARYGFAMTSDPRERQVDAGFNGDRLAALMAKPMLPVNSMLTLYGLVGGSQVQGTTTVNGSEVVSIDDTGLSYGLGAQLHANKWWRMQAEWVNYQTQSDYDISGLEFGVAVVF